MSAERVKIAALNDMLAEQRTCSQWQGVLDRKGRRVALGRVVGIVEAFASSEFQASTGS